MILTNEQLRTTLTGAAEIIERDGKLVCYRFGKYVREHVYPEGDRFHGHTFHTSGVISRFVTDSEDLSFTWISTPASGGQSFDVWADGVMYAHVGCGKGTDTLSVKLPAGKKTVEIYFPYHSVGQIYDVTLNDGACFEPAAPHKYKLLFIGDSITMGTGSGAYQHSFWVKQISERDHAWTEKEIDQKVRLLVERI